MAHVSDMLSYTKVDLLSLIVVGILIVKVALGVDKRYEIQVFKWMLVVVFGFIFVSSYSDLAHTGVIRTTMRREYYSNSIAFILQVTYCYLWFIYSELCQKSKLTDKGYKRALWALPVVLFTVVCVTTKKTHFIFYIDDNFLYHRGVMFWLQYAVGYGFILCTSLKALCKAFRRKYYTQRKELLTLGSFILPPVIFSLYQYFVTRSFVMGIGITVAVLLVYISAQDAKISVDPLTQLNNRMQLVKYLAKKMEAPPSDKELYLYFMDADSFKRINNIYGRLEGDNALVRIANCLRQVAKGNHCFVSRYGGDEFVMVCELEKEASPEWIVDEIGEILMEANKQEQSLYRLTLSVGYARYDESIVDTPHFIQEAVKDLNVKKKEKKHK